MDFVVYILYSFGSDEIYIGCTSNLIGRFHSHNSLSKKGYTTRFRPWKVIYCEHYSTKSVALKREKFLKSGIGRKLIWEQIREHIPLLSYIPELK